MNFIRGLLAHPDALAALVAPWLALVVVAMFWPRNAAVFLPKPRDLRPGRALKELVRSGSSLSAVAWTLGVVLLLATACRVYLATVRPIIYDEAYTFWKYSSRGFWTCMWLYDAPNNHIFHSLCVRAAYLLFGQGLVSLRLPSLVAGTLSIAAAFLLGRRLAGSDGALVYAAAIAWTPALLFFGALARGYALATLWVLVFLSAAISAFRSPRSRAWPVLPIAGALALWTVPTTVFPLVAIACWIVCGWWKRGESLPRRQSKRRWIVGGLLTAALTVTLYAPVLSVKGLRGLSGSRFVARVSATSWTSRLPKFLSDVGDIVCGRSLLTAGVLLALASLGLSSQQAARRRIAMLSVFTILAIVGVSAAKGAVPPPRSCLPSVPLLLLAPLMGLARLLSRYLRRKRRIVAIGLTTILGVTYLAIARSHVDPAGLICERHVSGVADHLLAKGLSDRDRIIAEFPVRANLAYFLHGTDPGLANACLRRNGYGKGRVWLLLVTNAARAEALPVEDPARAWPSLPISREDIFEHRRIRAELKLDRTFPAMELHEVLPPILSINEAE